jgi:hypothetical protein
MDCSICLEEIVNDTFISECKHTFHINCIIEYKKYKPELSCPMCRTSLKITKMPIKIEQMELGKKYKAQQLHWNYDNNCLQNLNDEFSFVASRIGYSAANVIYVVTANRKYLYPNIHKFYSF